MPSNVSLLRASLAIQLASPTSRDLARWHRLRPQISTVEGVIAAGGWSPACSAQLREARNTGQVERVYDESRDRGLQLTCAGEDAYPATLEELIDPPAVLWLRGCGPWPPVAPALTMVGSRRSTLHGRQFARALAATAARRGHPVLSGLALGIDQAAHEGAVEARGVTHAVLGCGLDRVYPPGAERLARRIEESGRLISEMPPGTPPLPHHFPRRNRLLAALAHSVLVVEADLRSGSLITARHALDLGRPVLAVPGALHQASARGTNRLIQDGAFPILSTECLESSLPGGGVVTPRNDHGVPALLASACSLDEIAAGLKCDRDEAEVQLATWEAEGAVRSVGDGRWLRVP